MQIDSSDNDSVISTCSENYSFITKKQDKKSAVVGGRVSASLPMEIADILFSEEEVLSDGLGEISSDEVKELSDEDIDFSAPEMLFDNANNQKESIDVNKDIMWVAL